jgi:hypothetical protein
MSRIHALIASLMSLALTAACGSTTAPAADAGADAAVDAAVDAAPPLDAGPDAPTPSGTVRELGATGGRVTGGALVLDVQLGHPFSQAPTRAGAVVLGGGAAINP